MMISQARSYARIQYNYFRDYDPALGRYAQSDPIGLRAGINTYLFVGANPLIYVDFYGLDKCSMNCTIKCNATFRKDENWRLDEFLRNSNCAKGNVSKSGTCIVAAVSFDYGMVRKNRRKLQNCLSGCKPCPEPCK